MTTRTPSSSTPHYFVLTDSHGKNVDTTIATSSYPILVTAIPGLQWIDHYKKHLSALSLLPTIRSYLSSAKATMFLIGTNSVRCTSALTIITQITNFITTLRLHHPHLSQKHSINIVTCFPCFKPLYPLCTFDSLQNNIRLYNDQLLNLSIELNFTVIDFHVQSYHISADKMHLDDYYRNFVQRAIVEHFECLSSTLSTFSVKTHCRSPEATARRNHRRHQKQAQKQKQLYLSRRLETPWTWKTAKIFLQQQHINFAKIPPIYKHRLRIQFNNPAYLTSADQALPDHAFSQQTFSLLK